MNDNLLEHLHPEDTTFHLGALIAAVFSRASHFLLLQPCWRHANLGNLANGPAALQNKPLPNLKNIFSNLVSCMPPVITLRKLLDCNSSWRNAHLQGLLLSSLASLNTDGSDNP